MAKKRKAAKKTKAKAPAKPAGKLRAKPAATSSAAPKAGGKSKLSPEDTLTAIMTAVAIAIVLGALYLYQQNVKPKTSLIDGTPQAIVMMPV